MLHTPLRGKPPCGAVHRLPRSPWKRHEHKQRVSATHSVHQAVIDGAVSAVTTADRATLPAKPPLTVPSLRASCPALAHVDDTALGNSMRTLQDLYLPHQVARLVSLRPEALALPLQDWCAFFQGYGLAAPDIWKVLRYSTDVLATTTPYRAGLSILFLQQQLRWSDEEVRTRAICCYPVLLARDPRSMAAVIEQLQALEMSQEDALRMVCEFPALLTGELGDGYMALLRRMYESRRNKYTQGGSYAV